MEYIKEKLENGLRVVYVPMEGTQTITAIISVNAGARHEDNRNNGIAHFLEHMAFKGTTRRPDKLAISRELDSVGAIHNAQTSYEYTSYWVKADSAHLELAIDILSDMFTNSLIPLEELEKERGVILGEIDMYSDEPMYVVGDALRELMYGDQPIGRDVLGSKETINAMKRDDFVSFKDKFYSGPQSVLVIAGKLDVAATRLLTEKFFSTVPGGEFNKPEPANEPQESARLSIVEKPIEQAHLAFGIRAYPLSDSRNDVADLLSTILGGSASSRLYVRIREELGLGYYVQAYSSSRTDYGSLIISLGVDVKRLEETVKVVIRELVNIRESGVTEDELKLALDYIKGHFLIDFERSDKVAGYFGSQELLENKILTPEQYFSKLEQITPEDVKAVAKDIFTNERLNLAVVGPVKDEEGIKKILSF